MQPLCHTQLTCVLYTHFYFKYVTIIIYSRNGATITAIYCCIGAHWEYNSVRTAENNLLCGLVCGKCPALFKRMFTCAVGM